MSDKGIIGLRPLKFLLKFSQAQQNTSDSLTRSIGKLMLRNRSVNDGGVDENLEKIADLRIGQAILRTRRDAFFMSRAQIEPPTEGPARVAPKESGCSKPAYDRTADYQRGSWPYD